MCKTDTGLEQPLPKKLDHESFSITDSFLEDSDSPEERDEVKEVQKITQKDTNKVNLWRLATTVALLMTAFVVTFTTYKYLKAEETSNFKVAVSFSPLLVGRTSSRPLTLQR
jgi:hypothetical protein